MPVIIESQNLQKTIPLDLIALKRGIRKILYKDKLTRGSLSFVFVDDRKIRALNRQYLHHDYPTDVLTFDWRERADPVRLKGEIIISAQTARRNARLYRVSVQEEILLYMIHGILHLLGYQDHTPGEIRKMRKKENAWMAHLGNIPAVRDL